MTPERWAKVGELFHTALEQSQEQRKQWVDAACNGDAELRAEVLSLLGSDAIAGEGFIEKKIQPAVASMLHANGAAAVPVRVGPYRLVRELGRGGMGTVYLAERDDEEYQAQVAIKLVRRGMDTDLILSRFYRERQTLARLQHPNIARLLDGGTSVEGYPYIVMEYVEGERITSYCRQRMLTLSQKLKLFLHVCKAVSYAHRQFVVHRDIKPGNILVDRSGDVKLLDFGICKLLQTPSAAADETVEVGLTALTPDYASPEQIRGDNITVASDIYSLAAVLYELLTGVKPHKIEDHSLRGLERAICETEIVPPSAASGNRHLKGDLDNILMVALDKDPQRRYESVDQFAEDIRRHLDHEPVKARPASLVYRAGKFLRRRHGLVAASAAVLAALSAGVFLSVRSARIANENLRMVRQLSNTFLFEVHDAVQLMPGSTNVRQLIVKNGLQYLEKLASKSVGDPDFQFELAKAYLRLADLDGNVMAANLGNLKEAQSSYQRALQLLDSVLKQDPRHRGAIRERIIASRRLGGLYEYRKELENARQTFQSIQDFGEAELARTPDDEDIALQLAQAYLLSSNSLRRIPDWPAAQKGYLRAAQLMEPVEKAHPDHWETVSALGSVYAALGMCEARARKFDAALEYYRKAGIRFESLRSQKPTAIFVQRDLMLLYANIGDLRGNPNMNNLGDRKGAVEYFGKTLAIARGIYEADPADQRARSDYATALARMAVVQAPEDVQTRIDMFRQAIDLQKQISSENLFVRADLVSSYLMLGDTYKNNGDESNALRCFREGARLAESLVESGQPVQLARAIALYRRLGLAAARNGDRKAASEYGQKILQTSQPRADKTWPAEAQRNLSARASAAKGVIHAAIGGAKDREEARIWMRKALSLYREMESQPTFPAEYRADMKLMESELKRLQ